MLYDAGIVNKNIDELELVSKYYDNILNYQGGYNAWKLANTGGSFAKLSTKSSLSSSLFSQLDDALTSAPSIKFDYGSQTLQSPKQFLNNTGNDMYDIILNNGGYAKFDNETGRLLYSEGANNFFIRYPADGINVPDVEPFVRGKIIQLRYCVGLNGSQIVNLVPEVGGSITTNPPKVTTFIGKVTETQLLKNQVGNFKHAKVGETPGSVNLLNLPEPYFNGPTWWVDHNRDWVLRAISRGDDFYIATPLNNIDLSMDNILVSQQYGPSYYARELNELVKIDYKPINITSSEWTDVKNLINSIFD